MFPEFSELKVSLAVSRGESPDHSEKIRGTPRRPPDGDIKIPDGGGGEGA